MTLHIEKSGPARPRPEARAAARPRQHEVGGGQHRPTPEARVAASPRPAAGSVASLAARLGLALAAAAMCQAAGAAGLKISALPQGAAELDLFSPGADGAYVKSVELSSLRFPIAIVEDRNGGFVIRLEGKKYYVNEHDVVANKVYDVTATCDNVFATERVGATRGITGKGC